MIEVVQFTPEHYEEWQHFLQGSNNGTLFHDLDFLSYHPHGRFATHHLIFRKGDKTIAVLPAAILESVDGKPILRSPYGASVGGLVLPEHLSMEVTLDLVGCLKEHAVALQLGGIEICLGPGLYLRKPNENLSFALAAMGFELVRRWLCHVVPLTGNSDGALRCLNRRKMQDVRMGLSRGLRPREMGAAAVAEFYDLLVRNKAKHQALPTHTLAELVDLFRRVPGRIRLFLCEKDGREVAGVLVFILNEQVANTFYICHDDAYGEPLATTVLLAHVIEQTARDGFRFLDLGPTTHDDWQLNRGLAFYKEGFGAEGFCRDLWRWNNQ
jgi:hypothetical protein